jgi:hypothetical protein
MEKVQNYIKTNITENKRLLEEVKVIIETLCNSVSDNIIFNELITPLKKRLNKIYVNIINIEPIEKCHDCKRYDIMTSSGKIELGLQASNSNQIHEMYDDEIPVQILREINEYNEIIYETEPCYLSKDPCYLSKYVAPYETPIKNQEHFQDTTSKNEESTKTTKIKTTKTKTTKEKKNGKNTRKPHTKHQKQVIKTANTINKD